MDVDETDSPPDQQEDGVCACVCVCACMYMRACIQYVCVYMYVLHTLILLCAAEMDADALLQDKDFLQSTLASLPGVDPNEVLQMMEQEQDEGAEEENDGQKIKEEQK